jgi:hypothetical protein
LTGHLKDESWVADVAGSGGDLQRRGHARQRGRGEQGADMRGSHVSDWERRCSADGRRNPKGKMHSHEGAKAAACGEGWVGSGWVGLAVLDPGANWNGNLISNFKWIWILNGLWEILQWDLEGIWTWGFFLNSSTLHKDF